MRQMSMDHSNHHITKIIGSDNIPPQKPSSSIYLGAKTPVSHTSTTSRKRIRESNCKVDNDSGTMATEIQKNDDTRWDSTQLSSDHVSAYKGKHSKTDNEKIIGMRLEAIFHPKFDNERERKQSEKKNMSGGKKNVGSNDIRSIMLRKLGLSSVCIKDGNRTEHTCGSISSGQGTGHLEVSLKHSGSLVLWSGSTRYYSKNSACNEFTRTAEILLRQWFDKVRTAMADVTETNTEDNNVSSSYRSYDDCSKFVSDHRYTIAFEVVTAEMLGDHGQTPQLDYVVVTAVANRSDERFLSTTEVLDFCHQYRLPHNDVWTFFPPKAEVGTSGNGSGAPTSAETLFRVYDNSLRETGYTDDTVRRLIDIADVYIPSPIPHSVFQGSICEGFIVRYIDDGDIGPAKERMQLEGLAQAARDILKEVRPTVSHPRSSCNNRERDPVLDANLRTLYQSISTDCLDEHEKSQSNLKPSSLVVTLQRRRAKQFSKRLREILHDGNSNDDSADKINGDDEMRQTKRPRRRRQRNDLEIIENERNSDKEKEKSITSAGNATDGMNSFFHFPFPTHHLPTLTKSLLESRDRETKRIARLLQTLDELKSGAVTYTWMEKSDGDHLDSTKNTSCQQRNRLYVIIHVHNDSTFFKFQSIQNSSDMSLFRGFCVELLLSSSEKKNEEDLDWGDEGMQGVANEGGSVAGKEDTTLYVSRLSATNGNIGTPLMLKMKLLPYMVRTFICRNLLNVIFQKGPEEFERISSVLLEKWNISPDSQERWLAFFRGWALYVLQYKTEEEQQGLNLQLQQDLQKADGLSKNIDSTKFPSSTDSKLLGLGPLTNFSYLRHLEHFTKCYEIGQFRAMALSAAQAPPEYHTFVCIVSQSTEVSLALANHFANYFNDIASSKNDKKAITDTKMVVCSIGEAAKNRRSKSCIAYANITDLTKGIKKFIHDKRVAKQSILILLGSNKDEIGPQAGSIPGDLLPSWLDILSEGEGKKLKNMWKFWKKFSCAKRIELGRSAVELEPKREDSITAVINGVKDMQSIVDTIQGVGRSINEQETKKRSEQKYGSVLVFFPGIPGCGKSSLLESLNSKLEQEMSSHKIKTGDLYDRMIYIKEGDKIGKKFWNVIEDLLSDDDAMGGKSSSLVIADKNAPPASWSKLGQIGHGSKSIMLPVLPDSSVMKTTTIEGSIQPTGEFQPHASHFYPFSLEFLAVSLSRVLSRPQGDHAGKLDCGFPMACMVVVQFFSFYRYIGADTFQEKMNEKFEKDGCYNINMLEAVKLPFLAKCSQSDALPDDLKKLLEEALQLRHGHDKDKKFKVKKDDAQMIDMEGKLRSSIERHKEVLKSLTIQLEDTKEAFVAQIMLRLESLRDKKVKNTLEPNLNLTSGGDPTKNVKLVSLDIDRIEIHKILRKYQELGTLKNFFDSLKSSSQLSQTVEPETENSENTITDANKGFGKLQRDETEGIKVDYYTAPHFIESTHVTMAFAGENNSTDKLISNFRHLQGREVTIYVNGFLWSSTNAALAIKISPCAAGVDSVPVPPCENSFAHVTVWCAPDVKAVLSNQLPNLVKSGKASRVNFDGKDIIVGKLSFWNHNNEPFEV